MKFAAWSITDVSWDINAPEGYEFATVMNYHHYAGMTSQDKISLSYVNINAEILMTGWFNSDNEITRPVALTALFIRKGLLTK